MPSILTGGRRRVSAGDNEALQVDLLQHSFKQSASRDKRAAAGDAALPRGQASPLEVRRHRPLARIVGAG